MSNTENGDAKENARTTQLVVDPVFTPDEISELVDRVGRTGLVADSLGTSTQAIRYWKNGENDPNIVHRAKLVQLAGTPAKYPDNHIAAVVRRDGVTLATVVIGDDAEECVNKALEGLP